ncbi:MAG: hypothetical protein ACR2NM_06915 [Bythopirellula sp.]
MKLPAITCVAVVLIFAPWTIAQETQVAVDLRQGVPQDAHLAIYGRNNPEREYQQQHLAEVWETFQEEKIAERFFAAMTSRVDEDQLDQARSVWEELQPALSPIDCDALLETEEVIYAQVMESVFNHHLVLLRLTPDSAAEFQRGFEQLFDLLAKWSEDKVSKIAFENSDANFLTLDLPEGVPFRPTIVRLDDVILFSSSAALAEQSLNQLTDDQAVSKFDDPRLVAALAELPEAEDAVIFFDGKLMMERFRGLGEFIRQQNSADNEAVQRWTGVLERVLDELTILDFEVTIEYTAGQQNRVAVLGKVLPDVENSLVYQAVTQGEPFENWQSWVPADAQAYSLNTGINLHVLYSGVIDFLRDEIPESHTALDRWEEIQTEIDFHVDRDLLQAFSGETVSITVPIEKEDGSTTQATVSASRCHDPEGVMRLIQRGIEALAVLPPLEAQQVKLVDCEELDGFQEIEAAILAMFKARPVIGFHDGWMMISSSPAAVAKVIATREGNAPAIDEAASYSKFDLDVSGPVRAVSYTDVGASVQQIADTIEQIGAVAPMFIGMMAMEADPEDIKPVQEIIGLLPSLAKVVRKFDFIEEQLSVDRDGPTADTYRRDSVWLIREADSDAGE